MKIEKTEKDRRGIQKRWRCFRRDCKTTTNIFKWIIFEDSKLKSLTVLRTLYLHVFKIPYNETAAQLEIEKNILAEIIIKKQQIKSTWLNGER